jgi:ribosomal protein S18 acetylase RimI-like enzyme
MYGACAPAFSMRCSAACSRQERAPQCHQSEVNIAVDTNVQSFAVANLRRRPLVVTAGPFVAGFDPGTTSRFINYATPLPGAAPTDQDVAALIAAFRGRDLVPRLEFAPQAAPAVEPALRRAGFSTEAVHDYLVCTPGSLVRPVPSAGSGPGPAGASAVATTVVITVEAPADDASFAAVDATLSEAFEGLYASSPEGVARLRRTVAGGGAVRLVRAADGTCAGAACCSAPAVGTAELSGIGTRPAYRGRGIAGALTAALAEAMFETGAESVWLEASGDGSRRVYERVGFAAAGTRLYLALDGGGTDLGHGGPGPAPLE